MKEKRSQFCTSFYIIICAGIVNCSVYIKGKVKSKKYLTIKTEEQVEIVLNNIEIIYRARGQIAKQIYAELSLEKWDRMGERDFAEWFRTQYLTSPMDRWCVCDTIPGCGVDNNPLESVNKVIKQNVCFEKTPSNLSRFIKEK